MLRLALVVSVTVVLCARSYSLEPQSKVFDGFKDYFRNPPIIRECAVKYEFGTNVFFTSIIYDHNKFLVRKEASLDNLKKRTFTANTGIAARGNEYLWYYSFLRNSTVFLINNKSPKDTGNTNSAEAQLILNGVMGTSRDALRGLFLGMPIWNCSTVTWSNNTLYAEAPSNMRLEAHVATITNGYPSAIDVLLSRGSFSNYTHLVYQYSSIPKVKEYPFVPSIIQVFTEQNNISGTITIETLKIEHSTLPDRLWQYDEYLNSSVYNIRIITNGVARWHEYNDAKQGYTHLLGLHIPNSSITHLSLLCFAVFTAILIFAMRYFLVEHQKSKTTINQ